MKKNKVCMKKSEFNNEHRGLIKLLRSAKGKKFKKEADEQEKEMKKYNESAPIFVVGIRLCEAKLTTRGRMRVKEENFALPGRRYPIHDASHARNALARVAQHGTPAEQKAVRAAVTRKYPQIAQEGMVGNAVRKVGGALWNRKGDIAAMALGAAAGRIGHGSLRHLAKQSGRAAAKDHATARAMPRGMARAANEFSARANVLIGKIAKDKSRAMGPGRGAIAGAISALATKKALGLAGRTALRAGKWAKRKVLGEGFGSQMSGLTSRIAVAKGGNAGQTVRRAMKVRQAKQTPRQNWKDKLMGVRKSIGGA